MTNNIPEKEHVSVDLDDNVIRVVSDDIDEMLDNQKQTNAPIKKLNVWLKPIQKKKLILKLIPFIILTLAAIAVFILCLIAPSIINVSDREKIGLYAAAPILLICFFPFCFYAFDRPYCQYNLKHNAKMKRFLGRLFVKTQSQNGCFELRRIYIDNPNTLAWNSLNGERIVAEYAKWDFESYSKDIKFYKEHTI